MDPSVPAAYGLSRLGLLALPALVSLHATALNTNLYAAYTLSMPRLVCARQTFFETVSSLPTPF